LANTAIKSGNFKEAIEFCNKVLERDSRHIQALIIKGLAVGFLDKPKESLNYFIKVIKLGGDPQLVEEAQNMIASDYNNKGKKLLLRGRNSYKRLEQEAPSTFEEDPDRLRIKYRKDAEETAGNDFLNANDYFKYALVFISDDNKLPILKNRCEVLKEMKNFKYIKWKGFDPEEELEEVLNMIHKEEPDYEIGEGTVRKKAFSGEWMPCFIATAAYNNPFASEVNILRRYRDCYLKKKKLGRWLIGKYYKYSSPLANWISKTERRRLAMRLIIVSFIKFINKYLVTKDENEFKIDS